MIVYLDTSAFVKLVVEERGSDLASALWDGADTRLTSVLTYAEMRAAIAAARSGGRLAPRAGATATSAFEARWRECAKVGVSEALVREAGDLADAQGLRGYDAVHLATVTSAATHDLVLASWDTTLTGAARRLGLAVAPD